MGVTLVVDASAGVELLLDTTRGRSLAGQIPGGAIWWAPDHYFVEVAGVLRRHEMHGEISRARAIAAFNSLHAAPALRRAQIRPLLPDAWGLRLNLTIADALYVALAEHLQATLLTCDLKLAAAVSIPTITA